MESINRLFVKILSVLPIVMVALGVILLLLCGEVLERFWEIASLVAILLILGGVFCAGFNVVVRASQKYLDKK